MITDKVGLVYAAGFKRVYLHQNNYDGALF